MLNHSNTVITIYEQYKRINLFMENDVIPVYYQFIIIVEESLETLGVET